MSAPTGFYKRDDKTHPITPRKSKRGYNASARVRVPHVSKYAGLSLDEARRLHEGRSPVAQGTDEGLKAPLAGSPGEWAANMNRLDLPGVDVPAEKAPESRERAEEPGHRRVPSSLDGVEWELDHLQGVALTRAEKAEGNSGNFEDYYDPLDRAYQQELLAARKRLVGARVEHPKAEARSSLGDGWKREPSQEGGVVSLWLENGEKGYVASIVPRGSRGSNDALIRVSVHGDRFEIPAHYSALKNRSPREIAELVERHIRRHKSEAPPPGAGVSREVSVEWRRRGEEAAGEYNAIISRSNREHRRPTEEERRQLDKLKETVNHANWTLRIHETQPKGPKPRAGRGFKEEAMLVNVATGAVVASSRGERNMVKIVVPKTGLYKMSHTHPSDTPHSIKDVHILISNDRLREMEVQTPNRVYTLKKTEKTPSAYLATRVYGKTSAALSRGSSAKYTSGTKFSSHEEFIQSMASELHLDFEAKER